jgi:hypothetical protein
VFGRRSRFTGAGASAEREFARLRRQNIRDEWLAWVVFVVLVALCTVGAFIAGGTSARLLAMVGGFMLGAAFVVWALGGHVSAFRWWLGAEGERETAKEIERLAPEWHCEHDLEHGRGNWDHVLVGPPGVFLLDSKYLHGTAAAGGDALRCGRLAYAGASFRAGAKSMKHALERQLGYRAPWVQAVVVIWGAFPQARHREQDVVYLSGAELRTWLGEQPTTTNAPQRAALVTALQEVRAAFRAGGS